MLMQYCVRVTMLLGTLRVRASEHRGFSPRTGQPVQNPGHSSVRLHSERCSGDVSLQDFAIIDGHKNSFDLRILESLYCSGVPRKFM